MLNLRDIVDNYYFLYGFLGLITYLSYFNQYIYLWIMPLIMYWSIPVGYINSNSPTLPIRALEGITYRVFTLFIAFLMVNYTKSHYVYIAPAYLISMAFLNISMSVPIIGNIIMNIIGFTSLIFGILLNPIWWMAYKKKIYSEY